MATENNASSKVDLQSLKEDYPNIPPKILEEYLESDYPIEGLDEYLANMAEFIEAFNEAPEISKEEYEKSITVTLAKMAADRLITKGSDLKLCSERGVIPGNLPGIDPGDVTAIDPEIAAHWARYRLLEKEVNELEGKEKKGKLQEITIKYKNKMKEEKYAISDYFDGKRNHPTTWDKDILRDYPSKFLLDENPDGKSTSRKKRKTILMEFLARQIAIKKGNEISAPEAWDFIPEINAELNCVNIEAGYQSSADTSMYQTSARLQMRDPSTSEDLGASVAYKTFETILGRVKKEQ